MIPQLIARIDTNRLLVAKLIHHLLVDIGKTHPQALVYPLTVATKSSSTVRKSAAHKILKNMSEHSPTLVKQALLASKELIRVAILWHEIWHEGLEEASRQVNFFNFIIKLLLSNQPNLVNSLPFFHYKNFI